VWASPINAAEIYSMIRRREFIAGISVAAWPLAASAQRGERVRRIGVLTGLSENDGKAAVSALAQRLADLGWTVGNNVQVDVRFFAGNVDRMRTLAKELIDIQPDLILADTTPATAALQRETPVIPIVFTAASDPVGSGFVANLPRPGGNITGFIDTEASMAGKWLELLIEIAPSIRRAAIMFNPDTAPGGGSYFLTSFEAAARSFKMEPLIARVHSESEIETVMTSLGREPRGGLVAMPDAYVHIHRALIISLAARNNVPAVYYTKLIPRAGGLLSYGADLEDIWLRAAVYVDRILRGAKPADLPVQLPIKFEMAVNVKTAKAIGLTIPESFLLRADEVIE
jgi:putative tryptophan/tyrosine transport system substrate-binding protein